MSSSHIVIDARIRRSSTGRYTDRLVEHLQTLDQTNHYTILVEPDDKWDLPAPNFETLPCPYPQFSLNPLHQIGFSRQLYNLKPDLVHFTMTQQPLFYFGKIVTTTHDLTMFKFVRRGSTPPPIFALKMAAYRFLVRWSHKKSDRIIVPSQFVLDDVAAYQPAIKNKLVLTYEASEPPLKEAGKQPKSVGKNDSFLLYVGTAFPHKNLPRLVEAFDILHKERPELKLVFTGKDDPHRDELRKFAQGFSSSKDIIFTGFVSDAELKWLYEHCAAYTFASLSEGFGLPPLEAMTYGAPVVASDASCIPEICGSAAHYFDAKSPKDMASKIAEVLDDKKLRTRLIRAGAGQVKKYSWQRMAEQTLAIYHEILD